MNYPSYSVLMSVYVKEKPEYLDEALDSMLKQTVKPTQIVMVKDGPLTEELDQVLTQYDRDNPGIFSFVSYEENRGLGYALSKGILSCENELVARMDTDDYSVPTRIERQLKEFMNDPELDMLGTQVYEFIDSIDNPISISKLPLEQDDIIRYSKRRNPFRHVPMVFKRSKVLEAGNYRAEYMFFEDWDLFNRMLQMGAHGRNLPEPLVYMRVSADFYNRRGGMSYLPYIWRFKTAQLKAGYFSLWDFVASFVPHFIVCVLPNRLRSYVYEKHLRLKPEFSGN